jgi:outer membrane protein OmpA-like peptidoglycan-associated protein
MKNTILVLICAIFLISCATAGPKQNQGTAVGGATGAAIGAGLGQAIGRNTESTLWGAAIGAAVGALAGNQIGAYMDRQQAAMQNAMSASIAANQASVNRASENMLMATFKSDVFFDVNSFAIKPGGYNELTRVANVLNQYPQTNIQVQGHTDRSGTQEYNRTLSQRRAETVQSVLMQNGVDPRRMTAIGMGESQPISSNPAQNRRVTLVLTPISNG